MLDEVVDGITNLVAFAGKQGIRPFAICVVGVANGIENLLMVDGQFCSAESALCQHCSVFAALPHVQSVAVLYASIYGDTLTSSI